MDKGGGIFLENGPANADEAKEEEDVNAIAAKILREAQDRRRILSMQQLADMDNPRPAFEQFFPKINAFFYSIEGRLGGEDVKGAMLAGNCMLIFAATRKQADEIAESGLTDTIHYANEYATLEHLGFDPMQKIEERERNAGVYIDALGRRKPH
jgi:hypothetical protein